ncbi:uncharacterized protein LOC105170691 isoform X2 [Sesamum indicum]|uniref:RBR-type E3 ubiquitin transferase n=1 Tax=Sesamum indicum TaxID=4182 RepID=A0A6I9U7J1_SESIN|nr:uncharacterized protein LOC105170691 isoform X2 [Sesamum indicum]
MEEDFDVAFELQVEEALTASLLDNVDAVTSPTASSLPYDAVFGAALSNLLQNDHLYKYEKEVLDEYNAEVEMKRWRLDISRQIHDRTLACEILKLSEEDWVEMGDCCNRPYRKGASLKDRGWFRLYVKGLVEGMVGAIGVAVVDGNDGLVFELSKGFSGREHEMNEDLIELKALTEGLDVAVTLDLGKTVIVTDNPILYEYIVGLNPPVATNVAALLGQINLLQRKLNQPHVYLAPSGEIKFAFELSRKAIALQVNRSAGNSNAENTTECCTICLEDTYVDQMYLISGCQHCYCFSCMSKHVQIKLLQGILPKCPYDKCNSDLKPDSCQKFLTPELFDIMSLRVKEASIPPAERIYCPYPRCSTLFSITELQGSMDNTNDELEIEKKCPRCNGMFCINCKVPWHSNMSCDDFKRLNPYPFDEYNKLKSLAAQNLWRQCSNCNHMVSLAEGCNHIYCRCGYQFCYACGTELGAQQETCDCTQDEENHVDDEQN